MTFAETKEARAKRFKTAEARRIYYGGVPVDETPAETYLRSRGWSGGIPSAIRFNPLVPNVAARAVAPSPVVLFPFTDEAGQLVAVLGAWFEVEGVPPLFGALAGAGLGVETRRADRFRFPECFLGSYSGAAARLDPEGPAMAWAAGLEDACTLRQAYPGAALWLCGPGRNATALDVPSRTRSLYLAGVDPEAVDEIRADAGDRALEVVVAVPASAGARGRAGE